MSSVIIFAFTLLVCVSSQTQTIPAAVGHLESNIVTVNVPTGDWLDAYLAWVHQHPDVLKRDSSGAPEPLSLPMPYLEYFGPTGHSLYRGGSDEENARFLTDLMKPKSSMPVGNTDARHPTLRDYVEMFRALKPLENRLLTSKLPTIFSVTYRNKPMCKLQNEALDRLRNRSDIQVIEVDLIRS